LTGNPVTGPITGYVVTAGGISVLNPRSSLGGYEQHYVKGEQNGGIITYSDGTYVPDRTLEHGC